MSDCSIYRDIAARTGGDIYIGVVGPVRTGKSTFITKFMDIMVANAGVVRSGPIAEFEKKDLLGKLAQPSYQSNEEGRIVVEIRVDASGTVVSASIATKGTTITDEALRNAAITAAKKNKFSTGGGVAIGTITYNFRLN